MPITSKVCTKCKRILPSSEFWKDKRLRSGLDSWCKDCCRESTKIQSRIYRLRHPQKCIRAVRRWESNHPKKVKEMQEQRKKEGKRLRQELIKTLGGKCSNCGDSRLGILQFDHLKGQGLKDRRQYKEPYRYYRLIVKHLKLFDLLCPNCNWKKRRIQNENGSSVSIESKEIRGKIFKLLGNECSVCGCSDKDILQIDHVFGNGRREKRRFGNGIKYYKHVFNQLMIGTDKYQLLCANCNWIKRNRDKEASTYL